MERNRRRILTGLAVTGVLAGALAGGTALATTGTTASAGTSTTAAAVSSTSAALAPAGTAAKGNGGTRYLRRHHGPRLVLRTAAVYLGLTPAELRTQLLAGKSLSAVATARGKSVSGLENAIVAAVTKRVDGSKLSAARKAAVIGDVKDNVSAFVNAVHPLKWAAHRLGQAAKAAASPTASAAGQAA